MRANYDTLTLKLQDGLDQYERYSEQHKEAAFFKELVSEPCLCLCLCLSVLTEFSIKDRRKWATWFPQGRQVCWCALLLVLIFNTLGLLSQPKLEAFLNKQQLAAEVHSRKERRRKDRSGMWGNQIV